MRGLSRAHARLDNGEVARPPMVGLRPSATRTARFQWGAAFIRAPCVNVRAALASLAAPYPDWAPSPSNAQADHDGSLDIHG